VIPFVLNAKWNLFSRTILPFITQSGCGERDTGFGDITQSLFFSPVAKAGGWMWDVGPVGCPCAGPLHTYKAFPAARFSSVGGFASGCGVLV
jgi:hypothetical protein